MTSPLIMAITHTMMHNWTGSDGVAVRYFDSSKINATGLSLPCSLLASISLCITIHTNSIVGIYAEH